MVSRLPDEYFRPPLGESGDIGPDEPQPRPAGRRLVRAPRPRPEAVRDGLALRVVVVVGLLSLLVGFAAGNVFWFNAAQPPFAAQPPTPTPAGSPAVASNGAAADEVPAPFVGPVAGEEAISAVSSCQDGTGSGSLIDGDPTSVWRCPGDGVGQVLEFTVDAGRPLVGVRLINGNVSEESRYLVERRILSVEWTLGDESRFVQGMGGNDVLPQEVRFPPTVTGSVSLTIVSSTDPGQDDPEADAVSLAGVEFLYPRG